MLQVDKGPFNALASAASVQGSTLADVFESLVGVVRRQFPVILITFGIASFLALAYCLTTPPSYTATATMLIDMRKSQMFQQQPILTDATADAGLVQTQVEVLKSQNISLAVIKSLHLTDDDEFVGHGSGLFGVMLNAVASLFDEKDARSEAALTRRALKSFEQRRFVNRLGITYAMEVSFRSLDPEKSARIANAIVDAYISDQMEAKYDATRRASVWLQNRIAELRNQASTAEKAVVDFKDKNHILNTGNRLLNEQQLSEINSQLVMAHAATNEAKARLNQIQEVMRQDVPDGSVADALKSEVIIKLRGQYLDLAAKEAIWSAKYGANHQAAINLRNQMLEVRRNIADEMQKIAESYKNDYQIAKTREDSIQASLASAVSQSQLTNQAQVQLRELESNAQSYRSLYDNFLQRYMESIQQQSFPISEARLISPASKPLGKSEPHSALILAGGMIGGLLLGMGLAIFREVADRVFRTARQVEEILHVNCLATLPKLKQPPIGQTAAIRSAWHTSEQAVEIDIDANYRFVIEQPFSQFAEGLRALKVATDLEALSKSNKVIGITSTLPGEGKSTIATNFASLIAHSGGRVLLIDADLRNPSLTRALAKVARHGLVDIISDKISSSQAIWKEESTGLSFIPTGQTDNLLHTNEILRSPMLQHAVTELRKYYDYIIIDLPPLVPVVDTRTTTSFIDSYVYVVEWGGTKIDVVEQGLAESREIYERLLGVVLNKADSGILGRYERYRSKSYYKKYYSRYGYTE